MNRDEAFEIELGQWLQEGPYEAPPATISAALAHVRAHPKRRSTLGSLWRHAMSGIGLTHLPSQPHRAWIAAGVVVAGLAVVVVGAYGMFNLGGQAGPGGGPTPTPVVTPTPGPSSTPRPTLGPGMATGGQSCVTSTEAVTTTIDEVVQSRGEVKACTNTSTDPRLAGDATIIFNWDEHPDGLWLGWGTLELRNDDGTWSGSYAITSTSTAGVMEFDSVWLGSGGYDGLEAVNHVRVTSTQATITSRVFDAGPLVNGTETCSTTSRGRRIAAGDVTAYRDVVLECTDTMSEPDVGGPRTLRLSIDERADGSADIWGTSTLANFMSPWEGFFFGTVDPGYTTHHVRSLMHGTGAYEGLLYRLEVVGTPADGYQLSGEIVAGP